MENNKEKLAILGGEPIRKNPFPAWPYLGQEEIDAVVDVIKKGHLSSFAAPPSNFFLGGEKIRELENNFASYHGIKYAISVNNATAGLHAALAAARIGPGDEVIVTPYSFTSSATCILMQNAIPVFADVGLETYNIDPEEIRKNITPRTKAIIVVHLQGNPARMDEIMDIAKKNKLVVIEDCAQAIGAKYKNVLVGTIGDIGVFSFNEPKHMSTGEGGMIITNNEELAERCRLIRNHGEALDAGKPRSYLSTIIGYNYRMTELTAAVGIEQLKKLDKFNEIRIENAHYLTSQLSDIEGLQPPQETADTKHVYYFYQMSYDSKKVGIPREKFIEALKAEGIPCYGGAPHPLYKNPLFLEKKGYGNTGCPFDCKHYSGNIDYGKIKYENVEKLCYERALVFTIVRPPSTLRDMDDVVSAVKKIIKNKAQLC